MIKSISLVTFPVTLLASTQAQHVHNNLISEVFDRIHNVSDTVLTRLKRLTAEKQEYLLSVTLGFTLLECILLIASSIFVFCHLNYNTDKILKSICYLVIKDTR